MNPRQREHVRRIASGEAFGASAFVVAGVWAVAITLIALGLIYQPRIRDLEHRIDRLERQVQVDR